MRDSPKVLAEQVILTCVTSPHIWARPHVLFAAVVPVISVPSQSLPTGCLFHSLEGCHFTRCWHRPGRTAQGPRAPRPRGPLAMRDVRAAPLPPRLDKPAIWEPVTPWSFDPKTDFASLDSWHPQSVPTFKCIMPDQAVMHPQVQHMLDA